MKIRRLEVGALGTNCYIAWCEQTRQAIVIDPGGDADQILAVIQQENLAVAFIVNTHGHADHIGALTQVRQETGAPVLIHQADAAMLTSSSQNLSAYMGPGLTCQPADRMIREGDVIRFGNAALTVLETPGHTPGGICLKGEGVVFSGDTLFAESIGRTDFPGGSYSQLIRHIREKLLILPDDWVVYPGHGPETTIGWERKMNPFIQ
ncbi:MAG: MBL fold metallo-hydrolase [Sporomusaceae bacterium]|nr:MBL fold metallo-hydrolase [Sporomusaceae bacterium]